MQIEALQQIRVDKTTQRPPPPERWCREQGWLEIERQQEGGYREGRMTETGTLKRGTLLHHGCGLLEGGLLEVTAIGIHNGWNLAVEVPGPQEDD